MRYRNVEKNSRIVRYGGKLSEEIDHFFMHPPYCPFSKVVCKKKPCVCEMAFECQDMVICPSRFEENNTVFRDIATKIGCDGQPYCVKRELKLSGCFFDFALKFSCPNNSYALLEIQALDISGSASGELCKLFPGCVKTPIKPKPVGPNWQMSTKTLIMELFKKSQISQSLNIPLFVAVQDGFWNYIIKKYGYQKGDGLTFLVYSFPLDGKMVLTGEYGISLEGLFSMILSEKLDSLETMKKKLESSF